MKTSVVKLTQPADPTIEQIFGEFLAEQRARLKQKTLSNYECAIDLLRDHLNGYAHTGLSNSEAALFNRHYHAEGYVRARAGPCIRSEAAQGRLGGQLCALPYPRQVAHDRDGQRVSVLIETVKAIW